MKTNKYKILVLTDLKDSTDSILQKAVKLSKTLDSDIHFFHVKKPTDIVDTDSQLSAMRNINKEYVSTGRKIKSIVEPIMKNEDITIHTSFAFGNIKNEIENKINKNKPNVIVLGDRKRKVLGFIGDNITDFILKSFQGTVVIASNNSDFSFENLFSLDFLNHERQVIQA